MVQTKVRVTDTVTNATTGEKTTRTVFKGSDAAFKIWKASHRWLERYELNMMYAGNQVAAR
jgi:hypothetical protein